MTGTLARADEALFWRVEEACRAAWPAGHETVCGDWLFRRSGGTVRRTNSVNLLRGPGRTDAVVEQAERFYAGFGQPAIFRVIDFADAVGRDLEKQGWRQGGDTVTLLAPLDAPLEKASGVALSAEPTADWLELRERLGTDGTLYRDMLAMIGSPKRFSLACAGAAPAAVAYGVMHDGFLVIESVATDMRFRNRGMARNAVAALMEWAAGAGATQSCLQVLADNAPARALYERLGYRRTLYGYRYWSGPDPT